VFFVGSIFCLAAAVELWHEECPRSAASYVILAVGLMAIGFWELNR
jgi:hypothetical protein